jgi:flagellar basal-body rod modification protein FlgD
MSSASQALSLLNRPVDVLQSQGNSISGTVKAVQFTTTGPELTVQTSAGTLTGIRLPQISLVRP